MKFWVAVWSDNEKIYIVRDERGRMYALPSENVHLGNGKPISLIPHRVRAIIEAYRVDQPSVTVYEL